MARLTPLVVFAILAGVWHRGLVVPSAWAQETWRPTGHAWQEPLGMSAADVVAVRDGRVVVTLPRASDPREIAAVGVVRVNATPRAFATAVLDVAAYVRGAGVRQAGRFSTPPVLADLDALTLPDADLEALRVCRVGQCGLKLPTTAIERLQRDVRWTAPDWRQQASAHLKQWIVERAGAYSRDGYEALPDYEDHAQRVSVADETRALMAASPYLRQQAPEFLARLGRPYQEAALQGLTRVLYWAVERHGYKPTLTIVELAVYQPDPPAGSVFAATTQLYATHYFEGAVTLSVATAPDPPASATVDLLYLYRTRIDALRGGFFGVKRFAAGRRIRQALEAKLHDTKLHLERRAACAVP